MSVLQVENVRKEYDDVLAVEDASFTVEDGEFVSILGPSGSGKSTMLRMVAGFESPTSGDIRINGENVVGVPSFERDTNMVFQNLALFPHLTVAENIAFGLKRRGVGREEREKRIEDILEVVELSGYGDRDIDQMSGGEQQRIALARAIVNEPSIILLDEPLASLDRKLRQHMKFELQRIQEETGITFLYVTHDQEVAMSISDRMVILNEGQIEQKGSVQDIYDRPETRFVAQFMGDLNSVTGTVVDQTADTIEFEIGDTSATVPYDDGTTVAAGDTIDIGIRPSHADLVPPSTGGIMSGTVTNHIYAGDEMVYTVDIGQEVFQVETEADSFETGDTVALSWDAEQTFLFNDGQNVSVRDEQAVQLEG
ncbi:ABC-type transport system ATP-binding protein (probable substrate spermidine/putrescine) [Natrialba magadii ATCC 43099]|uniref:Molybdate/tungstate import ATP-binding protein WtpC n=1 Tax=Natrialba magadii (strain ATCC 43099 / DSM 3394 / CCM 3739 / CIP 104546 / IAM 13178 / JCM 8861 / NBRC 102185 / NCIMB 2190 / MS3) TaxID=547559 RepID=D3SVW2_NATMM|nr:ABC transporter ATP-binding protein [Natrialba magadii]ADD03681.1 ABC-type transport system ATP-binding protein (probable substrate spermidine/putrescine) [Natrialba magadii ATCC 43099]ELY34446.1 ABC transporter [Natrialba magadii ATCC 43099]